MKTILNVVLFFFPLFSIGQESFSVSLEEAQQIAVENNLLLKDAKLNTAVSKAQVKETIADGLPQLNGLFEYTNNPLTQPVVLPGELNFDNPGVPFTASFQTQHASNLNARLDQLLFDGTFLLGVKAAKIFVDFTETQEAVSERNIRFNTAQAYFTALVADENINIIDKNISNLETIFFETKQTYEAGFVEQLDVDRLQLSLANLKTQKNTLLRLREVTYNLLKNTMTIPLENTIVLTDNFAEVEEEVFATQLLLEEAQPWPEHKVLEIQEELQNLNINRFKKGYFPTVSGYASGGYFGQAEEFGTVYIDDEAWAGYFNFGLQINIPLFDGNRKKALIEKATIERDQVRLQKELLDQSVGISLQNARLSYQNALASVQSQRDNVALAEKIYNTTKIKYKEGVGSSLELTTAEQELYTSQQLYIDTLYELLIAKVELEKTLGK